MNLRATLLAVLGMVTVAALIFAFLQRPLLSASLGLSAHPDIQAQLQRSLEDQKTLAELDPAREPHYRERFEELEKTVQRLLILEHNREQLERRYQLVALVLLAISVVLATGLYALHHARQGPRLQRIGEALAELARGRTDLELKDRQHDSIGRISAMIERTSRLMAEDRRRLASLENLSTWQEAARRQAHEMKTPLTSAQLELDRVYSQVASSRAPDRGSLLATLDGARDELRRLAASTQLFTSFARLPRPTLRTLRLDRLLAEFVETFATAWPNLRLSIKETIEVSAEVDRDLLRQVLVNLCDNSSLACKERDGTVAFSLEASTETVSLSVCDNGPGVAAEMRSRLFEPYSTTRPPGEGMGLGLAISRKILLDHGGDLEWIDADAARSTDDPAGHAGTCMRLLLPRFHEASA